MSAPRDAVGTADAPGGRAPGASRTAPRAPVPGRVLGSRAALWAAFAVVHGWLAVVGVVLAPARAFWDVDLYRYWAALALDLGRWPVLDDAWVYPAGALAPVVAPALTGARTTAGYAVAWCVLVTVLDALAVLVLLRAQRRGAGGRAGRRAVPRGVWWWLAFLLALGPVAMGRLDAVVAPLCVVALAVATRRPALAAALLTAGAWVKVAPGALLLPLVAVVRRPVRDVVLPSAAVCAAVVAAVTAGGGLSRIAGFVTEQGRRGLQVESVAATPWVVAGLVDDRIRIAFDDRLSTWEITGPGTAAAVTALGLALPVGVALLAGLLLRATGRWGRRGAVGDGAPSPPAGAVHPGEVLLWGALAATATLLVLNKVGSPQLVGWLAAPVVVALTTEAPVAGAQDPVRHRRWTVVAGGVLGIAALTQVVFPVGADGVTSGDPLFTAALAVRNVGLVALLAVALGRLARAAAPDRRPDRRLDRHLDRRLSRHLDRPLDRRLSRPAA